MLILQENFRFHPSDEFKMAHQLYGKGLAADSYSFTL